jgi:hypothetical protein
VIEPYQKRTLLISPFMGNGFTPGGVYVQHHNLLPPVLGRVDKVESECTLVTPGDVVVFRAHAPEEVESSEGLLYVITETALAAVLDGYDEEGGYVRSQNPDSWAD